MCHDNEESCKFWRRIDLSFQNWHVEFDEFWPEHLKVPKIFILMCSFWAKYILFELKKYRGVIFHETEEGCKIWRGIDLFLKNKASGIWQILTWALESLKDFNCNGLLLSKVHIVWAKKVQRKNLSWNWRGIQNLERNRLFISKLP